MANKFEILRYWCPFCEGTGWWGEIGKCLHCCGYGMTNDVAGWNPGKLRRTPRPPAVMRSPCADCAYRPGSPESENYGQQLPEDEPFWCHHGIPEVDGHYRPTATFSMGAGRGFPLGGMVCAGWWAQQTDEPLPVKPFKEK